MQVPKCTPNHGVECRTPCTLEMHYGLIPPRRSNIVSPSIPSKTRLHARFGLTTTKYNFKSPSLKVEVNGKEIHEQTTKYIDRRT